MTELIRTAVTDDDFAAFARLITEYASWCRERYREDIGFIDRVFGHQSLSDELKSLRAKYFDPNGRTFLAVSDGEVHGCGAYRRLADGSCEMKRLFVPGRFAGHGTGRALGNAILQSARDEGFALMRLDTGNRFVEAIALYESFGFRRCPAYHAYPEELMPYMVFMERPLEPGVAAGSA